MAEPGLVAMAPGNGAEHDMSGFGLPPGVDDGAAVVTDELAVPHPRLGVDGFADGAQQAQAVEPMLFGPFVTPLGESTNRGRGGIENVYLVAVDDAPETVGFGEVGRAFVHEAGGAVLQRSVNDVTVARDPSDVGGTPVSVLFLKIEHPLGGQVSADGIAAGGMDDALRFAGGSGSVKDVERVLGVERLGGTIVRRLRHQLVPPVIAARLHIDWCSGALVDHDVLNRGAGFQRFFDCWKKFDLGAAPVGTILGDDGGGLGVVNAVDQGVRGEPAEHDGVRRTDAGTGQHGNGQLEGHAHVDGNPVALLDSERFQDVGELLHFAMKLLISEGANFSRLALPNQCRFVFAGGLHMAVETVVRDIELAAGKPFCPGQVPFQDLVPLFEPMQLVRDPGPEFLRLLDRFAVDALVLLQALDVRLPAEIFWTFELSILVQNGFDIAAAIGRSGLLGHAVPSCC